MRIAIVVAFVGAMLAACTPRDDGPRTRPSDPRLRISSKDRLATLDPAVAYDEVTFYVLRHVVEGLVGYAPHSTHLENRLAEHIEITALPDGGERYVFTLREGIQYADGRPIVAEDFKYALERAIALPASAFPDFLADVEGVAEIERNKHEFQRFPVRGIEVRGERELEIRLVRKNAAFLYALAMPFAAPIPQRFDDAHDHDLRRGPLASGPYEIASWDEGQAIELRRHAHYFDPTRGRIPGIVLYENIPRDTQFLMFLRGELDAAERLSAPDFVRILAQPAWQPYVHHQQPMNAFGARFNVTVPPFDRREVRQAFNYALDRRHIATLLNGTAIPAHGILAPGAFGRDDALPAYEHDPARARALLAQAGYPDGLDVEYVTLADEEAEKLAVSMQHDLAEIGVRMQIRLTSIPVYVDTVSQPDGPAFSFVSWVGDSPDATSLLDPKFRSDGGANDSFYKSPELDAVLDRARALPDGDERAALYHQAERILRDDAPWVWGYHQSTIEVTQPYVRDYEPHPIWFRDYTSAWIDDGGSR
ncbi:MAG TPA: ABC transporter substrate-binding protein [Kofleriaceae bacterium]|nr:ABC transporter substrate-binding protein [Kofleriaceae bacterium]